MHYSRKPYQSSEHASDESAEIFYLDDFRRPAPYVEEPRYDAGAIFSLCVTVDAFQLGSLETVIMQACPDCINSLQIEPLAKKPLVRVTIELQAEGVSNAMRAVISHLPQAEFGPLRSV